MINTWSNIQLLLHAQLNSGHYKVWIAPLQAELQNAGSVANLANTVNPALQSSNDDSSDNLSSNLAETPSSCHTLTIYAPTQFVATRVKERYWGAISSAAAKVCGEGINLELKVGRAINPLTAAEVVEPASASCIQQLDENALCQENFASQHLPQVSYASNRGELCPATQMGLPLNYPLPLASCPPQADAQANAANKYSFDSFVVGPCNELAFAAARTLCNEMLHDVNTLFLNSGPGLGKTHLMQAMGHCIKQHANASPLRVACLTAEEFGSRMIAAIRAKETDRFKALYRSVDVLLLEDIHFLQGKEKMQEEVLSTIKYIRDRGGRVVFSSSFAPHELKDLDNQLASRFASGFLAVLEQPCFETRKNLFNVKAKLQHIVLPDPVTEFLAEHVKSDIRRIESCLHNLILHARMLNREISMDLAMNVIKQFSDQDQIIDLESIVRTVCRAFGIQPSDLGSKSRRANLVSARNSIFYLARKHTALTLAEIGQSFNRTHTSVIKGISSLEREISRQTPLGMQLGRTIELIERNSRA